MKEFKSFFKEVKGNEKGGEKMKIALAVNENYKTVDDVLNALHGFKDMGIEHLQLVNSVDETEENGEKYAVFDFEADKGILYMLVHDKRVINFLRKES